MKKILWAGILALSLAAGNSLWAFGAFEGEVDMELKVMGHDKTAPMKYFVKGHKLRTQMDSPDGKFSGGTIFDFEDHELITVMDKQKMYTVSKIHPEDFKPGADHHFKMHKAGNSETILGYSCEEWDYESDMDNGKIWFAQGFGNWWANSMASQKTHLDASQRAILNMVISKKMFPMKYEMNNKDGHSATMEVVKIEKRSLDPSLFEAPAGYKKLDMGAFGGMGDGSGKKPSKEDIMKMMEQFKK
jgi:hypothetical protein